MQKNAKRPVYLNLVELGVRLPIGGKVSIIHRATGAVMALLTPFALWALQASLESPARFEQVKSMLSSGVGRTVMLFALWMLVQHLYSGIRHLLMDVDVGVDLQPARLSARLTLIASVTTVALLGVLL
jgi:succinate dehydrogenase / fumarate reductase cytochrome b subunit